ncbi:LysR family transcriptional regulator [Micromonospora sp. WMMD980]|uniref:LysR family transcriptional regulator n=1 Tax=Micromonospora sp. WMMD980 TaxID=3016088 RepID=UPI002417F0ED|nr:LysR family transcriptional regulator [Micromonospora sp. WMMD980]MDG4801614.1 LysR family transcriptional regulator [Micromonospora sp. WMMD980]
MQWVDLHTFAVVAETLSFSRAAERLHLTNSAVVRRIQRLERAVGVRLLDRSTVRVAMTPAGVRLALLLPDLLGRWEQAVNAVVAAPAARKRLRLGTIDLYSRLMVEHFEAALPDVELDWTVDDSPALLTRLGEGRLDVVLVADFPGEVAPLPPGAHVVTVVREPIWLQISRVHPLADAASLDIADLGDERWVVSPPSQSPHRWETRTLAGLPRARVVPASQVTGRHMIDKRGAVAFSSALVRANDGFRVIPLTGLANGDRHLYLAWKPELAASVLVDRLRGARLDFYRGQARRSPAYWEWISGRPLRFPGIADERHLLDESCGQPRHG